VARTFVKRYQAGAPGSPELERLGLAWLAEATDRGGVRTPRVLAWTAHRLELENIPPTGPAPGAGEAFGRALAITHAAGAPRYGAAPPGWASPQGAIGLAPLAFTPPDQASPWGAFYARLRLAPYVRAAERAGALPDDGVRVFARLDEKLVAGEFDSPEPALVEGVSRIHGDLWAGNVLWIPAPWSDQAPGAPSWTGAVVIDPAAQGGHAETDLAMLALFGIPQLDQILEGYQAVSPLAPGWRDRVALHQLHPLLVHACLFGPSYGDRAVARAKEYL
jgi:fructosamine-3-kinase